MATTPRTARPFRPPYQPAPAPSGQGFIDALFSELERQRLTAATEQLAEERERLARLAPKVATGSPASIVAEMTDELSRLPRGEWSRRIVRNAAVGVSLRPDGVRLLAILVPETLTPDRVVDWERAVDGFCLFSGIIWDEHQRDPLSPLFMFTERTPAAEHRAP